MIDDDAIRWAFLAEDRAFSANARADAASTSRDWLRQNIIRLEKEVLLTTSIAGDIFRSLLSLDPQRASWLAEAVLSQYEGYRENREYPNLSDLLSTIGRGGAGVSSRVAEVDYRSQSSTSSSYPDP